MNWIAKLLKVLNSETDPGQIALALCLGMIMGLTPLASLHNLAVLFLVLTLRVNLAAFILGWTLFSGVAYLIDPLASRLGLAVLEMSSLEGLFTALYNTSIGRLSAFNNTITMGSGLLALILFVPLYLVTVRIVVEYRERILETIRRTKLMQIFKASRLYDAYSRIAG